MPAPPALLACRRAPIHVPPARPLLPHLAASHSLSISTPALTHLPPPPTPPCPRWLIPSECQTLDTRSAGFSVTVVVNFFWSFVIGQSFLTMLCRCVVPASAGHRQAGWAREGITACASRPTRMRCMRSLHDGLPADLHSLPSCPCCSMEYGVFFLFAGMVAAMTLFVVFFLPGETLSLSHTHTQECLSFKDCTRSLLLRLSISGLMDSPGAAFCNLITVRHVRPAARTPQTVE